MLTAATHLQFLKHRLSQLILGQHTPDRKLDNRFRFLPHHLLEADIFMSARKMRIVIILLKALFFAAKPNLVGIYNDYKIARINMRRINRLSFAH